MTEEIRTVLSEVEEKLFNLAFQAQDGLTKEERTNISEAWANVYEILR